MSENVVHIAKSFFGLLTPDRVRRRRVDDQALWHYSLAVGGCIADFVRDDKPNEHPLPACTVQAELLLRPDSPPIVTLQQFGAAGDVQPALDELKKRLAGLLTPQVLGGSVAFVMQFEVRGGSAYPPNFAEHFSGLSPEVRKSLQQSIGEAMNVVVPKSEQTRYMLEKPVVEKNRWKRWANWLRSAPPATVWEERFDPWEPLFEPLAPQVDLEAFAKWFSELPDKALVSPGTLGQFFQRTGNLKKAEEMFNQLVENHPGDVRACVARGCFFLESNNSEKALHDFDKAIALNETFSLPRLHRARILWELSAHDEAIAETRRSIELRPQFVESRMMLVRMLMALGKNPEALQAVETLLKFDPHNPEAIGRWACLNRLLEMPGADRKAIVDRLEHAMKLQPGTSGLMFEQAHLLAVDSQLEQAVAVCDEIIRMVPEGIDAWILRGQCFFQLRKFASAAEDFDQAVELGASNAWLHFRRAQNYWAMEEMEPALAEIELALGTEPDHRGALFLKGELGLARNDCEGALECFDRLVELNELNEAVLEKQGVALGMLGRFDESVAALKQAIAIEPGQPSTHFFLAVSLRNKRDFHGALDSFTQAEKLRPDHGQTLWERAKLLSELNCVDESIAVLDRLLKLAPDFPQAIQFRAALHQSNKNFRLAEQDYSRLIEMFPESSEAFVARASMWTSEGNESRAELDYQNAIEQNPELAEQIRLRQQLITAHSFHEQGNYERAIEILDRVIEQVSTERNARHLRGAAHWYSEQFVEAVEDFSWLLETSESPDWNSYSARGQVYAELGEFELAIEDLTRVIEDSGVGIEPNLIGYSLSGRGFALAGLGKFDEAEADFREAIRICPENAWLHFNQGRMHLNNGKTEQAKICFQLALDLSEPALTPRQRTKAVGFLKSCDRNQ